MTQKTYPLAKMNILIIVLVFIFALGACTSAQAEPAQPPEPTTPPTATGKIILSDVSDDPVEKIEEFTPLAEYLAANLAEHGISVGEVKVAPDKETMAEWLQKGEVDLYFDSPYSVLQISELSGAYPILRRWKDGVGEYTSVIAVRSDSGLKTLNDLNGHIIGFEDDGSSSGYFMPLTFLLDNEMTLVEKSAPDASVEASEVGYVFTEDDEVTVEWVFSGEIDAGAISKEDFEELPEEMKSELEILSETGMSPRHLVVVSPDIDPEFEAAVKTLLLEIHETEAGPDILLQFEETSQFDEITPATADYLENVRTLYLEFQGG